MTVWSCLRAIWAILGWFYGLIRGCLANFMAGLRGHLASFTG